MGNLRFRKSVKIAPGVKLNINKNSVGISAGVKGARVSVNSKGQKTTSVGIPGTGISYVNRTSSKSKAKTDTQNNLENYHNAVPCKPLYCRTWFVVLLLLLFFPVGLFLMWKYTSWHKAVKIIVTACLGVSFISLL